MQLAELRRVVLAALGPELASKPGAVLFSDIASVRPGPVYVVGVNPGGKPHKGQGGIVDHLAPAPGYSHYTHDCWQPGCPGGSGCVHLTDGRVRADALVLHQKRMIQIAGALGHVSPATLPSANGIFGRSSDIGSLKKETFVGRSDWWRACWPVHQQILREIRPNTVITLGYGDRSSSFGLLVGTAGVPLASIKSFDGGGREVAAELDLGDGDTLSVTILGIPHPSYFAPSDALLRGLLNLAA